MLRNVLAPNFFLKFYGFWDFNKPDNWFYRVHRTVGVVVFVLCFSALELLHLLMLMIKSSDIIKITDDLTHAINHLLGMYKFFTVKTQRDFIQQVHELSVDDDRITYEITEIFEITKKRYFDDCTIMNIKLILSGSVIAFFFIVTGYGAPFIAGGEFYLAADNLTLMTSAPLPFNTWVPFSEGLLPHYFWIFAYQGISMFDVVFMIACCDSMFIGTLNQIFIQLRLLRYMVTTLHQRSEEIVKKILQNSDRTNGLEYKETFAVIMNNELKKCIRHHQIIFEERPIVMKLYTAAEPESVGNVRYIFPRTYQKISSRFSRVIFFQFTNTLIVLCVSLFQCLVRKGLTVDFMYMIFFAMTITYELFLFCWSGKEITEESEQLPNAIFASYWLEATPQYRANFMLFLIRSQRPVEFTALGLLPLNLITFGSILKKAYSFFSVLKQMDYG